MKINKELSARDWHFIKMNNIIKKKMRKKYTLKLGPPE
jgi:hypothetical protein